MPATSTGTAVVKLPMRKLEKLSPSELKVATPPLADTARYDRLRSNSDPVDSPVSAIEGARHEA